MPLNILGLLENVDSGIHMIAVRYSNLPINLFLLVLMQCFVCCDHIHELHQVSFLYKLCNTEKVRVTTNYCICLTFYGVERLRYLQISSHLQKFHLTKI